MIRSDDLFQLLEPEIEDVFLLAKHAGAHEPFGLLHQCLLVDEIAADHRVLRIFPVAGERPHAIDHPLGLFGLLLSVGQHAQARQQLLLLLQRLLSSLLEATLGRSRLEVLDVAEDQWQEHGRTFAPSRPRDVDLADAAHAVFVEPGLDGVARFSSARELVAARRENRSSSTC